MTDRIPSAAETQAGKDMLIAADRLDAAKAEMSDALDAVFDAFKRIATAIVEENITLRSERDELQAIYDGLCK